MRRDESASVLFLCVSGEKSCCLRNKNNTAQLAFSLSSASLTMGKSKSTSNKPAVKDKPSKRTNSNDHYNEEGDLEIISSDGVVFKLHAYRLQASS
jgi:hypothetical protein